MALHNKLSLLKFELHKHTNYKYIKENKESRRALTQFPCSIMLFLSQKKGNLSNAIGSHAATIKDKGFKVNTYD